jgi:hypothetical protein
MLWKAGSETETKLNRPKSIPIALGRIAEGDSSVAAAFANLAKGSNDSQFIVSGLAKS